jgi:putative endonuclease
MAGMAAKDDLGRAGEDRAAAHLEAAGYRILDRNWRTRGGEIDIVAEGGGAIAIVEVKTRSGDLFGDPLEAVDARKRARLWRLAVAWRQAHPESAGELRLDAIAITGPDPASAALVHLEDLR